MLGKLVVQHNGALALLDGRQYLSVAWYSNWREMIKGLQKNFFAGLRYSWFEVGKFTVEIFTLNIAPYIVLFFSKESPFGFCFHLLCLNTSSLPSRL
jgi:hypothetical protein